MALYATRNMRIHGREYRAGEEVDNLRRSGEVRVYVATGRLEEREPEPAPPAPDRGPRYRTRRLKAQD